MKKRGEKNLQAQILSGYRVIIVLMIFLVAVTLICLARVRVDYGNAQRYQNNRSSIQAAIAAHYEWLDELNRAIQKNEAFTGSLDPTACSFGKWSAGVSDRDLQDDQVRAALNAAFGPHEDIHNLAKEILDLAQTDQETAYERYLVEIQPNTKEVIADLGIMDERYTLAGSQATENLYRFMSIATILIVLLTAAGAIFALRYAKNFSRKISRPIVAVSEWAGRLSLGIENLEFDEKILEENQDNEVGEMIRSFAAMADNIREHVEVIKRVANGDMTAFVNIRSSQDSLGQNLYRMVQSNDMLFNEIVQVAHTVAVGAEQIAKASQSLSESVSVQAGAVDDLSETVIRTNQAILESTEKTREANEIADQIHEDAGVSAEKMRNLVESVEGIRASSERISTVIKSIEDIAFETNILALNASVEAARAGEAGKGFVVVADEVRALAQKSAQAVKESRGLIEETIQRVQKGSAVAADTSEMFRTILDEMHHIIEITREVAEASEIQLQGVEHVKEKIEQISQAATSNAAISEESAASSHEMRQNADELRQAMGKFRLRYRREGKPYIPPEKANDDTFIRYANEAYHKAQETGKYGYEYIDPEGKQLETKLLAK